MLSNGAITIDTTRAYRGVSSLHSHISGGAAMSGLFAIIGTSKPFPVIGAVYARVWVYFATALPSSYEQFLNFTDAGTTGISVGTDTGALTLDDYALPKVYQPSATKLPLGRWACIGFVMSQGSTTGAIQISLDGNALADIPATGPTPTVVQVLLGLDFTGNTGAVGAYDAWFDELVVDNKPIACTD